MISAPRRQIDSLGFLVVEDNAFTSIVVNQTLKSLGAERVSTARTGREALDLIEAGQTPPDVLLIDLRMPEMGGVELMGRLADRGYQGHVIVTSGVDAQTLASVEEIARESGVAIVGCLAKPLQAAALEELLSRILDE
jgi:CheY-like chemotaxis protein